MTAERFMALMLLGLLALPPTRALLESEMALHMLVQIPFIMVGGALLAIPAPRPLAAWDPHGIATLLLALFCGGYWMLPRALDAALDSHGVEAAKFLSLALFVGVPLHWCWSGLHPLVRGLVWSNLLSMLFVLGWLYLAAPARVCNNYLIDQQAVAGRSAILMGVALALWLAAGAFRGRPAHALLVSTHNPPPERELQ